MKKKFEMPAAEVCMFITENIITTSTIDDNVTKIKDDMGVDSVFAVDLKAHNGQ